jgi:hypothetical protein
LVLLSLLLTSHCAGQTWCVADADGASVEWPAPPDARRGHEGPRVAALIMSTTTGGASYELALFHFARATSPEEQAHLLAQVERGLAQRGAPARASSARLDDAPARALTLRLADGRIGRWRLALLDDRRMLQLSVVGADDASSERFFASFRDGAPSDGARCAP